MRLQKLCLTFVFILSSTLHAEEAALSAEAVGPFSEVAGPVSIDSAMLTLRDADFFLIVGENPEVVGALLLSATGLGLMGMTLAALGEASAQRRYRAAAAEGMTRLTAREATPISNSAPGSSLRLIAQLEEPELQKQFPDRSFSEAQLTSLIIAQARRLEMNPE